jgi:hypothetical protein
VIVSTTHPKVPQGETVYDQQDDAQRDAPVVPGFLLPRKPLKQVKPHIAMSSRMHHRKLNIMVEGVVTANADVIDTSIRRANADAALAESVLDAFSRYKFKPATLDGKPIAVLLQVEFHYNIF